MFAQLETFVAMSGPGQLIELVGITMLSPTRTEYRYNVFLNDPMDAPDIQQQLQMRSMGVFGPCVENSTFTLSVEVEVLAVIVPETCKSCYDVGYEQGQMDCEPLTTGAVTSDPHISGLQKQRYALILSTKVLKIHTLH